MEKGNNTNNSLNKNKTYNSSNKTSKYDDLISKVDPLLLDSWKKEQDYLKSKVVENDDLGYEFENEYLTKFERIAGMDISASKNNPNLAVAALVVCNAKTLEILYEKYEFVTMVQPYVPGFLAFREVDHLKKLINDLKNLHPELIPQIILLDGNGILHCNRFGLACHLGVLCDIPTIGCSKTVFSVDGIDKFKVKNKANTLLKNPGDCFNLQGNSGQIWGAALKSTKDTTDPIIVSIGHKISLNTALKIVKDTTLYRVPEPIRISDKKSRQIVKQYEKIKNVFDIDVFLTENEKINRKNGDEKF
jgi:deoxyinosine 3'endonuclease (endonuclease V)